MNEQEMIRTLAALRYADAETVRMFDLAFPQFIDEPVAQQLQEFRDDHQGHVERLDTLLRGLGHAQPEPSHEFMAMVQEHLGMIDRSVEPDDTIQYLLMSERETLAEYDAAAGSQLPDEVAAAMRAHHADEQRHVDYLEQRAPVLLGAAAARLGGTGSSPPHGVQDLGVGTGGSLGGAGSSATPAPPKGRRGAACKPAREREESGE